MPTLNADQLHAVASQILRAAGASPEDANVVAGELRDANLVGHDSHGVIRLMQYVGHIEQGHVHPGATIEVLKDGPSHALLDGHFSFGQVCATRALAVAMGKARAVGTSTVMISDAYHVGRVGSYTHKAAMAGFVAMCAVNSPGAGGVAPFGGIERRMGTNPISIAAPWGDSALVLDMTTSATAEGKLRVARQKSEPVPEGWIIDREGNPSTNPEDFYAGGALLPLGGPLGYKGFGLGVMIDVLCGVLTGKGLCRQDLPPGPNGLWLQVLDIERFVTRSDYDAMLGRYVAHLKSSPKLPGVKEILMPGEIEQRHYAQRIKDGVSVPDETWRQINELAARLGVVLQV